MLSKSTEELLCCAGLIYFGGVNWELIGPKALTSYLNYLKLKRGLLSYRQRWICTVLIWQPGYFACVPSGGRPPSPLQSSWTPCDILSASSQSTALHFGQQCKSLAFLSNEKTALLPNHSSASIWKGCSTCLRAGGSGLCQPRRSF